MLEVTVNTVDGVEFVSDVRVLEADEKYMGVPAHHIREGINPEIMRVVRAMGFRKVGRAAFYFKTDIYVASRFSYYRVIITRALFRCYWSGVKWLYDNARFFKQIPEGSLFSWSYFTPYCWYLKIKAKF